MRGDHDSQRVQHAYHGVCGSDGDIKLAVVATVLYYTILSYAILCYIIEQDFPASTSLRTNHCPILYYRMLHYTQRNRSFAHSWVHLRISVRARF